MTPRRPYFVPLPIRPGYVDLRAIPDWSKWVYPTYARHHLDELLARQRRQLELHLLHHGAAGIGELGPNVRHLLTWWALQRMAGVVAQVQADLARDPKRHLVVITQSYPVTRVLLWRLAELQPRAIWQDVVRPRWDDIAEAWRERPHLAKHRVCVVQASMVKTPLDLGHVRNVVVAEASPDASANVQTLMSLGDRWRGLVPFVERSTEERFARLALGMPRGS